MAANDFRSYGWTYVISGSAFAVGGAAMVLNAASLPMYLVPLVAGPILLVRGILYLQQKSTSSTDQPSSPNKPAAEENAVPASPPAAPSVPLINVPPLPPAPPAARPSIEPEPAWLRESFSSQPLRPILPTLPLPTGESDRPSEPARSPAPDLWAYAFPCAFFLGVLVLTVYLVPILLHHWRISEAQSEAEAIYLKRRAELRADLEHAEDLSALLDKQTHQLTLGYQAVARKVKPMVVSVSNLTEKPRDPFARSVYDPVQDRKFWVASDGTGFIAGPGSILTNHHVVKEADHLRITFASGQAIFLPYSAVASDTLMDLAIIRVPPNDDMKLALQFADSDKDVNVGSIVLAVGSPFGLKQTVTHGIISAKGRLTNWLPVELLQTDAAINPGNSGGPLLDLRGRVVGVTVAIASDNGRNQGVGFAIPSNVARKIFEKLVSDGEVPRGFLGVNLRTLDERVELGKEDVGAVLIEHVFPSTPAAKAGLRSGDVVVRFNQETLVREHSYKHLQQMVASHEPGTEVSLEVLRNTQRLRINVTLGKRPRNVP